MTAVLDPELTITGLTEVAPRPDVASAARLVGLKDKEPPTLEAVERRRWQLWLLSMVFLFGMAGLLAVASIWPDAAESFGIDLATPMYRGLLAALSLVLICYTIEKEMHLRALTRLLIDERVLSGALSNRLAEVGALLEAGKAMNSVLELDAVLDVILTSATSLLDAESGSIMLLGPDDVLRAVCVRGNDFAIGAAVPLDQGIAGQVARNWEPVLVSGQASNRFVPTHTSMCVPLLHRSQLVGVLNINGTSARPYSEYDLRALSLFAEQAASAIANARLYEIERRHVAELVEGEMRKTEFLAGVSHDLRTPLTSLIGCTKMLQRQGLSESHRLELAAMVDRQAGRLSTMIEDLLTAARLEVEQPTPLQPVDAAALAREVASQYVLEGRDVVVVAPVSSIVEGTPEALRRILSNLLDNAFKHGSGRVGAMVGEPENGFVDITIADNGPGIPGEVRERVFERFFRLDENRAIPGIGLGLSIVQGLVVGCGGKVWIEDAPDGRGTVIRVRLRAF